jgi:hypothetical protein
MLRLVGRGRGKKFQGSDASLARPGRRHLGAIEGAPSSVVIDSLPELACRASPYCLTRPTLAALPLLGEETEASLYDCCHFVTVTEVT